MAGLLTPAPMVTGFPVVSDVAPSSSSEMALDSPIPESTPKRLAPPGSATSTRASQVWSPTTFYPVYFFHHVKDSLNRVKAMIHNKNVVVVRLGTSSTDETAGKTAKTTAGVSVTAPTVMAGAVKSSGSSN